MAATPCPALQREQQRAADIIRLLTLYRPLLDAYVIVSVPRTPPCPPCPPLPAHPPLPTGFLR